MAVDLTYCFARGAPRVTLRRMSSALTVTVREHVADVVLSTGSKGNALGPRLWEELPSVFGELDRDAAVRAVVLRADGPHFTYGLDLPATMAEFGSLFQGGLADARTKLHDLIGRLQGAVSSIANCRKPVVAAVQGLCLGGGVDIISACDVRVCSQDARFSIREVRVAMVADIGTLQRISRLIGEGHARELALTGRDIDADRALRIGLVNDVHATHGAACDAARAIASEIAANPPLVVQGVKTVMNERVRAADEAGLRFVAAWNAAFLPSADLGEALAAFMEKRAPRYEGK
jgi:enoyl-CoA hydratase